MSRLRFSIGAQFPRSKARKPIPCWVRSHTDQSLRLIMSRKSTASDGSNVGFTISSG